MAPNISFWRSFSSMVLVESRKTTYASAISDTGDKVEFPPKRHANASRLVTPKAKDVVATTPSMPRAWSDTFLTDVSAGGRWRLRYRYGGVAALNANRRRAKRAVVSMPMASTKHQAMVSG